MKNTEKERKIQANQIKNLKGTIIIHSWFDLSFVRSLSVILGDFFFVEKKFFSIFFNRPDVKTHYDKSQFCLIFVW